MGIRSEKRPSPFDDARPSEEKRVRLPIDASLSARAYSPETPDISNVADENYDACFGMIYSTVSTLNLPKPTNSPIGLECSIMDRKVVVRHKSSTDQIGFLDFRVAVALGRACERFGSILDAYIPISTSKLSDKKAVSKVCIIVYGILENIDEVGGVLNNAGIYLQHPKHHDSSVPYNNPHYLLRPGGKLNLQDDRSSPSQMYRSSNILPENDPLKDQIDQVFDSIQGPQEFSRVSVSRRISTTLKNYQEKALSMMMEKESGIIEGSRFGSLWSAHLLPNGQTRYQNAVTKIMRSTKPPLCLGGLLADDMGLGKSLTTLALISATLDRMDQAPLSTCCTTLIVTPMSLISSWEEQIKGHLNPDAIKWFVYHGDAKRRSLGFANYDVVLTTYNTIATEYAVSRDRDQKGSSPLKSFYWHRVVLDEAHWIRNASSVRHKAVQALRAQHRWCLTGTPIFNRIEDLGSLVNFLRVHPFDSKVLADHIVRPLKINPERGLANLKSLLQAISLRRTKQSVSDELSLVPRIDRVETIRFSQEERRLYNKIRKGFSQHLKRSAKKERPSGQVLQTISRLRQFCDLGCDLIQANSFHGSGDATDHESFARLLLEDSETCTLCGEQFVLKPETDVIPPSLTCDHRLCSLCSAKDFDRAIAQLEDCPFCSGFLEPNQFNQYDDHDKPAGVALNQSDYSSSSKVQALLRNLEAERQAPSSGESSKSVVLSSWTRMLDAIEVALKTSGFTFARVDGTKSESRRRIALDCFRNEKSCTILLASLGSVGVGLNLTAASNVHLVEPQWSPMAEEQALDRVHRLGQARQVVATRYVVENSIEEYVVAVQRAKTKVISTSVDQILPTNKYMEEITKYVTQYSVDCETETGGSDSGSNPMQAIHDSAHT